MIDLTGDSPELKPLLDMVGIDPATVEGFMLHLQVPMGIIVFHSFCCDHAYRAALVDIIRNGAPTPIPTEDK